MIARCLLRLGVFLILGSALTYFDCIRIEFAKVIDENAKEVRVEKSIVSVVSSGIHSGPARHETSDDQEDPILSGAADADADVTSNPDKTSEGTPGNDHPETISLDEGSSLFPDIKQIHHYPDKSEVVVFMKATARCQDPMFVGRLSGPALVSIENWTKVVNPDGSFTMRGTYKSPMVSAFYIEIITVFCNTPITKDDVENLKPFPWPSKDWCLEQPQVHRITAKNNTITVEKETDNRPGYWRRKKPKKSPSHHASSLYSPVYTRVQPAVCHLPEDHQPHPECAKYNKDYKIFEQFEFVWKKYGVEGPLELLHQDKKKKVCYSGWSHSKTMAREYFEKDTQNAIQKGVENITLTTEWVPAHDPQEFLKKYYDNFGGRKCDALILGFYQHPASGQPQQFQHYYDLITELVQEVKRSSPQTEIYFRNPHVNPHMAIINKCPPTDGRNRAIMEAYYEIGKRIARENNLAGWLDDSFMVEPMWDWKIDYNHMGTLVGMPEALYLTLRAIGYFTEWESDEALLALS